MEKQKIIPFMNKKVDSL